MSSKSVQFDAVRLWLLRRRHPWTVSKVSGFGALRTRQPWFDVVLWRLYSYIITCVSRLANVFCLLARSYPAVSQWAVPVPAVWVPSSDLPSARTSTSLRDDGAPRAAVGHRPVSAGPRVGGGDLLVLGPRPPPPRGTPRGRPGGLHARSAPPPRAPPRAPPPRGCLVPPHSAAPRAPWEAETWWVDPEQGPFVHEFHSLNERQVWRITRL